MTIANNDDLLNALLEATTPDAIRSILTELGDFADAELDKPFGPFNFCWHAYGGNQSNVSSIGLGTKPGRSLTERLTNAMDAILEDQVQPGVMPPRSPRLAAKEWFGRPVSGREDGLFNWDYSEHDYDRRFAVIITDSGEKSAPTIDVLDAGIGIPPEQFPNTILSLQAGNKINRKHVIGAFGQGGASTLKFSDYVLIVSRHRDNPRIVGFTVIRVLRLSGDYKEDCYGYLCQPDGAGGISVLSCQRDGDLVIYPGKQGAKAPSLPKGTMVRHVGFRLPALDAALGPSPGNLYHYLHCTVFDPLLPFRVIDLRSNRLNNQLVTGSRNRLMKLIDKESSDEGEEGRRTQHRHHRDMEFFAPHGAQDLCIGIEYWVVLSYHKTKGLRPHSNEVFIQRGHPIIGSMNGQNQGELTALIFREAKLGMVSRHIIVHIDATKADSQVRRDLFSTNREGFVDGPVLISLTEHLKKMVEEDEILYEIERELVEKLAQRESKTTSEEVRRQVQRLLQEAGLALLQEGPANLPDGTEPQTTTEKRKGKHRKQNPLLTLPYPEVTKFDIITPQPKMSVHIGDSETVLVETDADSRFDQEGRVAIKTEPNCLEQASKVPLSGGRVRWRLRPRTTAKAGDTGKIIASITKPDGDQIRREIEFEVLKTVEEKTKKAKGFVPPFEIVAINPTDDAELWAQVWPDLSEGVQPEDEAAVAYKPLQIGGGITVFYSTIFGPFHEQVEKLTTESPALSQLFRNQYEIWIAYHAILQENGRSETMGASGEQDSMEAALEAERTRVARMQVRQAKETAQLMHKAMRDEVAD